MNSDLENSISYNYGMWVFLTALVIVIGVIIVVIIIEKGKAKRIDKFKKMSPSKINTIGNYEDKATKKYPINLNWNKNTID